MSEMRADHDFKEANEESTTQQELREVAEESLGGDTTSFSLASSVRDPLEVGSSISEVSSTPTEPGYFLLDWRAESTPGAVRTIMISVVQPT